MHAKNSITPSGTQEAVSTPPTYAAILTKRLDDSMVTLGHLSQLLINNGAYKGEPAETDFPAQIDDLGESGIQIAIKLLADIASRDISELAIDQGIILT